MLTQDQIDAYHHDGFVKVEGLFSAAESADLAADMVRIIEEWGEETIGWKGPWRDRYLKEEDRLNTKAVFLHRPDFYSDVWARVIHDEKLVACVREAAAAIDIPADGHDDVDARWLTHPFRLRR